ncbi:MAG TPA: hypothetical protein VK642_14930, partial [Burkholderiales bacterium]|nr:hypothetical protein [Burkholderiales bacterium]
ISLLTVIIGVAALLKKKPARARLYAGFKQIDNGYTNRMARGREYALLQSNITSKPAHQPLV